MHNLITGKSVPGILHFLNQTPTDWLSKHQNQVEAETYGSEFMAAQQALNKSSTSEKLTENDAKHIFKLLAHCYMSGFTMDLLLD